MKRSRKPYTAACAVQRRACWALDEWLAASLLKAYQQTLSIYLRQQAKQGGDGYAQPNAIVGIDEARANIQRIKAYLRGNEIAVEDGPNDTAHMSEPLRKKS